jgi:hypothetical protein
MQASNQALQQKAKYESQIKALKDSIKSIVKIEETSKLMIDGITKALEKELLTFEFELVQSIRSSKFLDLSIEEMVYILHGLGMGRGIDFSSPELAELVEIVINRVLAIVIEALKETIKSNHQVRLYP